MGQRRIYTFVVVALCLGGSVEASVERENADSLFQAAVEQIGRVPVKESIRAFRRVLKADPDYAPAHHEIAKLYIDLKTPESRQQAHWALDRAMRLDPQNVTYQQTLGDLLWAQGYWYNAANQYEKVLETSPEHAEAAYKIGYHALKNFMKYIDMEHLDRIGGLGGSTYHMFSWKQFGEKDRDKAIAYLEKCIQVDPGFRDAYYQLGLVHFESSQPEGLVRVSKQLLKQMSDDKDGLLFCGLGFQSLGNEEAAYKYYTRALRQMGPEERAMMESVDLIATEEEKKQIALTSVQDTSQTWGDSAARARFWRRQDPLFLTGFNERRMEHYGRIAYANLRFSRPSRGIEGWQTDMGKAYIRFGRYLSRKTQRGDIDIPMDGKPIGSGVPTDRIPDGLATSRSRVSREMDAWNLSEQKEVWFYEGFKVAFRVPDGFHGHLSAPLPDKPRYVDPYRRKKYSLPHQVVAFQDGDSIRVEISSAVPKARLKVSGPEGSVHLGDGIFLFDEHWEAVYRKRQDLNLKWPAFGKGKYTGADSLRKSHLLSYHTVSVAPGPYRVVSETRDRMTGSIGTFREVRAFSFPDSVLAVSDLLLASRIEEKRAFPESRKDLKIMPNPLRTFGRSEPVFIYLEVYNLMRDEFGRTAYEMTCRVGRPKKKEIDPALFVALDLLDARARVEIETVLREEDIEDAVHVVDYQVRYVLPERNRISQQFEEIGQKGRQIETAVTSRYEGDREDDFTYLQIDVARVPVGIYNLTVTVKDVRTEQIAERDVLFRIME